LLVLQLLAGQVPSWVGCRAPQDHVDHGVGLSVAKVLAPWTIVVGP
jgi:hypothetical protein